MNKHTNWHYVVLGIGIFICITAVSLMFKGIKFMMNSLFDDNQN